MANASLREIKKSQSRTAILHAAMTLFLQRGYDKTTLADIAALANVSQRTIFTYFPSKEAIIFYPEEQTIAELFDYIDNRGDMKVLDALKIAPINTTRNKVSHRVQRLIGNTPALQEYFASMLARVEHKLTLSFAEEKSLPPDSIQAHMVGSLCRTIIEYTIHHCDDIDAPKIGLDFIDAGLQATTKN